MTVTDLAEHFEVSRQTIYNWRDAGCPIDEGTEAISAWLKINRPAEGNLQDRLLLARIAKMEADAEAKQIENRVSLGRLVDREAVERWLSQFVSETRQRIEGWPDMVLPELPGDVRTVADDILREQVRLLLHRLADMPSELWADEAISGDSQLTAAESAGE